MPILSFRETDIDDLQEVQGDNPLPVQGTISISQATPGATNRVMVGAFATVAVVVARPADTNAYIAKDVYNTAAGAGFVFNSLGAGARGAGVIVKARLATDQKTNVASYRLHLWNAPVTFIADNSPFLFLYVNETSYQGSIDFDAMQTEDSTNSTAAYSLKVGNLLPFVCAASATLYGELEILDAFTPASAQSMTVTLTASQV